MWILQRKYEFYKGWTLRTNAQSEKAEDALCAKEEYEYIKKVGFAPNLKTNELYRKIIMNNKCYVFYSNNF